jgi:hypothetical protein
MIPRNKQIYKQNANDHKIGFGDKSHIPNQTFDIHFKLSGLGQLANNSVFSKRYLKIRNNMGKSQ